MDDLRTDLERAVALQNVLVAVATGERSTEHEADYKALRSYLIDAREYEAVLPSFVRSSRTLHQFWAFIKSKSPQYEGRRVFIWQSFEPLLDQIEGKGRRPLDDEASAVLKQFNEDGVHAAWAKALDRRATDPEGAITAARTLLETVCKHILDGAGIPYDANKIELHELYKLTANELNIAPSQHTEEVFKQILGGCSAIVSGLGTLRNRLGDAHGKGARPIRPASRHAELAVNLAGAMATFLVATWESRINASNA
ncbi:abortive infection family protein [Pseudomonas knackmussii]|uniref:abortive infection family protein n=1 Tax=Pseudomonas knackmussii TaxID=65741 RepID=UPI003F49B62C